MALPSYLQFTVDERSGEAGFTMLLESPKKASASYFAGRRAWLSSVETAQFYFGKI